MKALLFWLCLLLAATATSAQPAVQVVDDRGATVRLPRPPQRIVTLLPSLTETVCELGACARLVGVDNYSNWPASVRALPHVGGLEDANIEVIVALRPDVVLLSNSSRALARLEGLGVPVVGLDLKTLADVRRVLGKVSQLLATGDAEALWQRMNDGLAAAARTVPVAERGTRTYFEVGGGGYAASTASHIGEVLARLGAANVVPGELGSVPKLNPEFIVRADPQLVIVGAGNAAELPRRPGWDRIRAVRDGRICAFTPAEGDVIMRPGPRLADAARILARCLQPAARGQAG